MAKAVKSVVRALPAIAITFAITWATGGLNAAYLAAAAVAASAAAQGVLVKQPKLSGLDRNRSLTLASGSAPQVVVYGQQRVGTVRVFAASSPEGELANGYLHQVLALARTDADGVEEIGDIWFNDQVIPLVPSGAGYAPPAYHRLAGAVYIEKLSGGASQAAPAVLVGAGVGWTDEHRLQGIAALYVRLRWDKKKGADTWPDGLPQISAVVKGQKVTDPRTGQKAWTNNFALCVRDYLLADHGYACRSGEVDDAVMIAAANLSDETVTQADGATQKRYTVDTALYLDGTPGDTVDQLLGAGMATLAYTRGAWRLYPAAYRAPAPDGLVLTADHLRDAPVIDMDPARENLCNRVKGRYTDATTWVATDFPQVEDAALIARDGEALERDIELPAVKDPIRAQRLAKIELRRSRRGTVQWPGTWACVTLRVGDTVPVTLAQLGWDRKVFRVDNWELAATGGIDLVLREEAASDYAWTAAEEQALPAPPRTNLSDPAVVATPFAFTALASTQILADGSVLPVIRVDIVPTGDAMVRDHLVRLRRLPDPEWQVRPMPDGSTRSDIPVQDGAVYAVSVAAQNARGVTSAWTAEQLVTVAGGIAGARVAGLELFGQGTDTIWEGRDVRIVWRGAFPDTAQPFGGEPYGAGTAQLNPYFRGYVVRVYDPDTGMLLREEAPQTGTDYTYGYDANVRDGGPRRRLRFAVSILPKVGPELGVAVLDVSNPTPALPADLAVVGVPLAITVSYRPVPDSDWRGVVIYMAETAAVPLDEDHLAYRGPDTNISLDLPAGGKRWLRVAQIDAFGEAGALFTPAIEVTALAISTEDLAAEIIGDDLLTEELRGRINLIDGPATMPGSVAAKIQAEAAARVTAIQQEADARVTGLLAEAAARGTAITNEASARALGDSANAFTIAAVEAVVNHPTTGLAATLAAVVTEQTARVNGDSANASSISVVAAQVNHPSTGLAATRADLVTEQSARVSGDSANASSISSLSAVVNNPTTGLAQAHARITTEETARVSGDSANASSISSLSAVVNNPATGLAQAHARITTEETARATAVSAVAAQVTTLSTTVGNNTASITTQALSIDGLSASYTVKVDVGGKAAGFGLASTANDGAVVSHFAIRSDKFSLSLPGESTDRYIFTAGMHPVTGMPTVVISGALYTDVLNASQITAGQLSVDRIGDGTIPFTKIGNTLQSDNFSSGSAGWRIKKDGSAEFNGVVISRPIMLGQGYHSAGSIDLAGPAGNEEWGVRKGFMINTDIDTMAWLGSQEALIVNIGFVAPTTASTHAEWIPQGQWGVKAEIVPTTNWYGVSKLFLWVEIYARYMLNLNPTTLLWRIYKVT